LVYIEIGEKEDVGNDDSPLGNEKKGKRCPEAPKVITIPTILPVGVVLVLLGKGGGVSPFLIS